MSIRSFLRACVAIYAASSLALVYAATASAHDKPIGAPCIRTADKPHCQWRIAPSGYVTIRPNSVRSITAQYSDIESRRFDGRHEHCATRVWRDSTRHAFLNRCAVTIRLYYWHEH